MGDIFSIAIFMQRKSKAYLHIFLRAFTLNDNQSSVSFLQYNYEMVLATSVNISRSLSVRTDMHFDGKFPLLFEKDTAIASFTQFQSHDPMAFVETRWTLRM
jgi:hypothetical protein